MNEGTQVTLLRRMTRSQDQTVADDPPTASRAVRLALTKAANDTVGLVLTVLGVAEEVTVLDDMLDTLDDDLMLIGLKKNDHLHGVIALDMQLRAAIVEMQTMGALVGQKADDRSPTRTDQTLSDPLLRAFLTAFPAAVLATPLDGWMDGITHADRIESTRAAGLVLDDVHYRIVRMSVDLGIADRHGMLIVALPLVQEAEPVIAAPTATVDWEHSFGLAVSDASASFDAVLHKFPVPLATAQSLQVGSVLPLTGCTVNSVRLIAPDGQCIGQAKLGQTGGYRAVRLEHAPAPQLSDLPAPDSSLAPSLSDIGGIANDAMIDLPADLSVNLADANPSPQDNKAFPDMPEAGVTQIDPV